MTQLHALLLVFVAFCVACGWGVFHSGGDLYWIVIFTVAAIVALQLSYVAALVVDSLL